MSIELTMLAWTVVLGLVQVVATGPFYTAAMGLPYAASSRDTPEPGRMSVLGGRVQRAARNLGETFPFAAAAILVAAATGRSNAATQWGAQLYFWGRLAYFPVYVAGIAYVRTAVWLVSIVGIVLVLAGILRG